MAPGQPRLRALRECGNRGVRNKNWAASGDWGMTFLETCE
jgi:hypothetical protein